MSKEEEDDQHLCDLVLYSQQRKSSGADGFVTVQKKQEQKQFSRQNTRGKERKNNNPSSATRPANYAEKRYA